MTLRDINSFEVGQTAEDTVTITSDLVAEFSRYSGDDNPLHMDAGFADRTRFKRQVAHGLSYASVFSRIIGTKLPGTGALWMSQSFQFAKPVFIGDTLSLEVRVHKISKSAKSLTLQCRATNQHGEEVLTGVGEVMLVETEDVPKAGNKKTRQKIALVIGGSRGIGAAITRRLSADGFQVALTYNSSRDEAKAVAESLNPAVAIQADAATPEGADKALEGVVSAFGSEPDTLVFCPSSSDIHGAAAGEPFDKFDAHFRLQVGGLHALVTRCLNSMQERGFGNIIAIGTTATEDMPPANMAPYTVAKAALASYVRCLAVDYGHLGIRANMIAPGMTETSLVSSVPDRQRKVLAMQTPLRRLGLPEDVAKVASFLASDDSAYVTGEIIRVSGGS